MILPKNIRGIHIFCTTCSQVCSNTEKRCKKHPNKLASKCEGNKKYQSRIRKQGVLKIKTWHVDDKAEVIKLHEAFRETADVSNYKPKPKPFPTSLGDCMSLYIDWLQDYNLPEHEQKQLSKDHVLSQARYLKRFLECANRTTPINTISSDHVGKFHASLKGYARRTYNHHIQGLQTFFDFLIGYGYKLDNPFKGVVKKAVKSDPQIVTEEELQNLLNSITPENSWSEKHNRNMYREWLKPAILLFLYTGGRRDDIWLLKWEDKKENYLKIPNHKLNNKAKEVIDFRPLYITDELARVLLELGGDGEGYIICPEISNRDYVESA